MAAELHPSPQHSDVYLSHHWGDSAAVGEVVRGLEGCGQVVHLRWEESPGDYPWSVFLHRRVDSCSSLALVIGRHGMDSWQQREMIMALDRQRRDPTFRVVPILLPGAEPPLALLSLPLWIDLRSGVNVRQKLAAAAQALQGGIGQSASADSPQDAGPPYCPYRGLGFFREEDSPLFFGREPAVSQLISAVKGRPLVAVVGPSGVGKTSVVRAGLLPHLRRFDRPLTWECVAFTPGDKPFQALAGGLAPLLDSRQPAKADDGHRLASMLLRAEVGLGDLVIRALEKQRGTDRLLIVVDQWEELYTLSTDPAVVRAFVDQLLDAVVVAPCSVVLTLRGDFVGSALSYRPLSDRLQGNLMNLGPMTDKEVEQVIIRPAEKVGLRLESGLAQRILQEVSDTPGGLPLLEFALAELWRGRDRDQLLNRAYDAIGGLQGAVATRAEQVHLELTEPQQSAARWIWLRLVRLGPGTEEALQPLPLSQVDDAALPVVDKLAAAGLLVRKGAPGQESVAAPHEALVRHWARLRTWLREKRLDLHLLQQVQAAAREWESHGRSSAYCWTDERVVEAAGMLQRLRPGLTASERNFLGPVQREEMLLQLDQASTTHRLRATIGERLALLGDARPGVGVRRDGLPDILWCRVPGGDVLLQSDSDIISSEGGTARAVEFPVQPFWIACYPVTWAQYRAFLEAPDGYDHRQWWRGLAYGMIRPGRQFRQRDNHPAENVSWYDAVAFCRWLSTRLGYGVRLPLEWEWQQAATGGDPANTYPWGPNWDHSRVNTSESGLDRSTAVGVYPRGASRPGALDMGGNVWEWCANEYERPQRTAVSGTAYRALRGGSWFSTQDEAQTAYRYSSLPFNRYYNFGFRLASSEVGVAVPPPSVVRVGTDG